MGLVFDDVVGIIEVINCKDVKVQVCMLSILENKFPFFLTQYNHWNFISLYLHADLLIEKSFIIVIMNCHLFKSIF